MNDEIGVEEDEDEEAISVACARGDGALYLRRKTHKCRLYSTTRAFPASGGPKSHAHNS